MKRRSLGREIEWERNEVSKFIFTFYYDNEDKQCRVYTKEMGINETKIFIKEINKFYNDNFLKKIFKRYFIFTTDTGEDIYLNRETIFDFLEGDFIYSPVSNVVFTELGLGVINDENDSSVFINDKNLIFESFEPDGCNYREIYSDCSEIIARLSSSIFTDITIFYTDLNIFDGWNYNIISNLLITMVDDVVCFSFITNKETDIVFYFSRDNIKTLIKQYEKLENK